MINNLSNICLTLDKVVVKDLFLLGYVGLCNKSDKHFTFSSSNNIFFKFEDKYLRCNLVKYEGNIKVTLEESIQYNLDFEIDEDDNYCVNSISSLFWGDVQENYFNYFRVFYDNEQNLNNGIFKCIEFGFKYGEKLLLDPINFNGLRLGIGETLEIWKEKLAVEVNYLTYIWKRNFV